jgi:hypothetical protein
MAARAAVRDPTVDPKLPLALDWNGDRVGSPASVRVAV